MPKKRYIRTYRIDKKIKQFQEQFIPELNSLSKKKYKLSDIERKSWQLISDDKQLKEYFISLVLKNNP